MGELLFGVHPVYEALVAQRRRIEKVYIAKRRKDRGVERLSSLATRRGVPVTYVTGGVFKAELKDVVHQGVAARVGGVPVADMATLLAHLERDPTTPMVLAPDGIVDPQNLGSIIRSARAMGVQGVVLPKARCAPLSAATSKASAGAMEQMPFVRVSNMVSALQEFKKQGYWIVGATARTGVAINEADLSLPLVLVVGGEEKGLRPLVSKTCDFLVSIPQVGEVDSLNAAVAGAIAMYEVMRQRRERQESEKVGK